MSTAVTTDQPVRTAGKGWLADVHLTHITLAVDPAGDDLVLHAIEALISPVQQRFWTLHFGYVDNDGWDVWYLDRATRPPLSVV